jgi:hypothetical protein
MNTPVPMIGKSCPSTNSQRYNPPRAEGAIALTLAGVDTTFPRDNMSHICLDRTW